MPLGDGFSAAHDTRNPNLLRHYLVNSFQLESVPDPIAQIEGTVEL
jgi:hypothetical protein